MRARREAFAVLLASPLPRRVLPELILLRQLQIVQTARQGNTKMRQARLRALIALLEHIRYLCPPYPLLFESNQSLVVRLLRGQSPVRPVRRVATARRRACRQLLGLAARAPSLQALRPHARAV